MTRGYIVGFTDLGNTDEFSTEMLAWRLGHVSLVFLLPSAIITLFVLPFFCNRCARSIAIILCIGLVLLPFYSVFSFKAEVINYKGDLNTPPDQVKYSRSE